MFCKSIVLLACLVGSALSEICPVLKMSEVNSLEVPAFQTLSEDEFGIIMAPEMKESMVLCFVTNNLTNSDLKCSKSDNQGSCYDNLKGVVLRDYYPQVQGAIPALKKLSSQVEEANFDDKGDLVPEVQWKAGTLLVINLNNLIDANGFNSRDELLGMHDMVMHDIYKKLSQKLKGKITTIYTCNSYEANISKSRHRRETDNTYTWFRSGTDFLISFTELAIKVPKTDKPQESDITKIKIDKMELPEKNDTAFSVNLIGTSDKGAMKLNFLISLSLGYFKMSKLTLNDEAFFVPSEINAPTDFSYSCGNQTFFGTNVDKNVDFNKILMWNSLQMQAPFNNATKDNFTFGDAWYCVGFFSSGILAGLFVVFILLGILSVGICWMLDINTMDRFDDPKGKTITINVSE